MTASANLWIFSFNGAWKEYMMALLIKSGYSAANLLMTAAGFWWLGIITHLQRNLNEYYIIAFSLHCWENVYFIFKVIMYVYLGIGIATTILFWIIKPEWRSKLLLYSWMFTISVVLVMLQWFAANSGNLFWGL